MLRKNVEIPTTKWMSKSSQLAQAQRPLVLDIFVRDRAVFVAQVENPRHNHADSYADSKKDAIGRETDQHRDHDRSGNEQPGRALHAKRYVWNHDYG